MKKKSVKKKAVKKKAAKKKTASSQSKHSLKSLPSPKVVEECKNAKLILKKAYEASGNMLHCFDLLRTERGNRRGGTTDNEQAALRAMLIMAAAGLDSMVKQLIRDSLTALAKKDEDVDKKLMSFLERILKEDPKVSAKLLSFVLTAECQRTQVIELYVQELTGSSLQSPKELFKAANALGISPHNKINPKTDGTIFKARNQMIHELDIDLEAPRRSQNQRGLTDMIDWTDRMFEIATFFLTETNKRLKAKENE